MNFTPEQTAAITAHDRNLIVTAGAGSGKTRVLVARFMDRLRSSRAWTLPSVVAITFTEKAAREMRDRVRAAIADEIRAAAGDQAALDGWLEHQAALTRARIGTIHALCASILRANPAEAHLDPAFEVLDETEAAILRDDAVDEALARLAAEDRPGTALLAAYDVRDVRRVLFQFAERSRAQTVEKTIRPDLLAHWQDAWTENTALVLDEIRTDPTLRAALDFVRPADLPPGDKLSDVWRTVHAQTAALLDSAPAELAAALDTLVTGIDLRGGSAKNWGDKDTLTAAKDALKSIRARLSDCQKKLPPPLSWRDEDAARWLMRWQDATRLAAQIYAVRKQDRTVLDFDDLETRARDLLVNHDSVVARYAAEFNHILVDEFQDTNAAQRDIIYRLAGVGETGADGRLFVVGDPKQSIYAFRGADVSVFGAVRDDLCQRGGLELPLSTSFRTHDNLVAAFNDLFGRILTRQPGLTARYEVDLGVPMTAFRPAEPDHAQPLTVFVFPRPDKAAYPTFGADDIRRWEAWTLAQHIHTQIAQGARIWDRGENVYRPMGYGDVAILFQSMTRVPLYEDVFKAAGLPYVTVAGKGYYDRQEVWDLLNLLRALHNPADDLALAAALRSPLFGLSDDALLSLRLARDDDGETLPLWTALMAGGAPFFPADDLPARDFARRVLRDLRDMAGRAPIADLLMRALDLTGFMATLTGLSDGARRRGNVEKLVRLARASGRVSLGAFNAYARDLTAREVREGEAAVEVEGAVTIMSVHASKGLEFPVVILADAAWSRNRRLSGVFTVDPDIGAACRLPTDDPDSEEPAPFAWTLAGLLADRRDQAERRRLLYVGATRAQDHLIVSGSLYRSTALTWLRQWLAALGVDADDIEPQDEPYFLRADWGTCALYVPPAPALPEYASPEGAVSTAWDDPAVIAAEPIEGIAPELPPLLASVPLDPTAPARALTATQLTRLGRAPYYDPALRGWAAVRDSVLFDAPDPLRPLPDRTVDEWALRRLVGEIVHRALQVWSLPDNTPEDALIRRLETYAWAAGLSDDHQISAAVTLALDLLRRFGSSPVRADLDRAQQVYRELPFAYRAGPRTLYGQIDVLYFDGREWHVLDYKTAPVSWQGAEENARRYYMQVGAYAEAVAARTGQTPHTHLYYIHPGRQVYVKSDDWRAALDRLEDDLHIALDVDS
jgi:ATP-dependent helicase/nuclease subunit A